MDSPPSSTSSTRSFDVFWKTDNLLLTTRQTPSKKQSRPTTTATTNNDLSITTPLKAAAGAGGTKRNSTLASLPSPTSLSKTTTTTTTNALASGSGSRSDSSSSLMTGTGTGARVNKRTRTKRNVAGGGGGGGGNEDLDELTLKALGALTARLNTKSNSGGTPSLVRAGSMTTGAAAGTKSSTRRNGRGGESEKQREEGKGKGVEVKTGRKEEDGILQRTSSRRSNNENVSIKNNSSSSSRLLPASLTSYRSSTATTTTAIVNSNPPLPPSISISPESLPLPLPLPTTSKSIPPKKETENSVPAQLEDTSFDEYFDTLDDESFELALSQLESNVVVESSSSRKTVPPPAPAPAPIPVPARSVGVPLNRVLVVQPIRNNTKVGMKLPTTLPPPRTYSTKPIPLATVNMSRKPLQSTTATTTTTTSTCFRFSGPVIRTSATNLPLESKSTTTMSNLRGAGGRSKSLAEKKALEELVRKEMEGMEELVGAEDWDEEF